MMPWQIGWRLIRKEVDLFRDLWLLLRAQHRTPAASTPLKSERGIWTLPGALGIASTIEILVTELLIPNHEIRIAVGAITVYSFVLFLALWGRTKVYPSYVLGNKLVIRRFGRCIVTIPSISTADVTMNRSFEDKHLIRQSELILGSPEGTNCTIKLQHRIETDEPRYPWQKPRTRLVDTVHLWLDEPELLIRAANQKS